MFRTRLFGASLVISVLINVAILAIVGILAPSAFLSRDEPSKLIRLQVYHPPVEKQEQTKKPHRIKEARKVSIPHHVRIARATPAPPSAHPRRRIAESHASSLGRRPIRMAAMIRPAPPSMPKPVAHVEEAVRKVTPAAQMPKVVTVTRPAPTSAPPPSQDQGSGSGTSSLAPLPVAPASGSAGGNGDYEHIGSAPGSGGDGGGGPFGIGPGGGGEGPRHIVYVLDVSPSMKTRIDRARGELRNALSTLEPGETFDIIAFGGDTKPFSDELEEATPENIADANRFLDKLDFIPGTDLQSALYAALAVRDVNVIVLITDGVPTVGETDFGKIARHIRKHNGPHARIYTIGLVGKNPDGTDQSFEAGQLLQQLARDSGGDSRLVPLGEATPDE